MFEGKLMVKQTVGYHPYLITANYCWENIIQQVLLQRNVAIVAGEWILNSKLWNFQEIWKKNESVNAILAYRQQKSRTTKNNENVNTFNIWHNNKKKMK